MIPSFYCLVSLWCSFMPNAGVLPAIAAAALTCRTNIKRMPKKCQLVFGNDANLIEIPTRRVLTFFFYFVLFFSILYIYFFFLHRQTCFRFLWNRCRIFLVFWLVLDREGKEWIHWREIMFASIFIQLFLISWFSSFTLC